MQNQLKENLRIMHSFQICHCDIKPFNIVWSRERKRALFIDFGLSKMLKEKVGYLSYASFLGTFQYCSEEMKKLYYLKHRKYIDLYYNDTVGLSVTLKKF